MFAFKFIDIVKYKYMKNCALQKLTEASQLKIVGEKIRFYSLSVLLGQH